MTFPDRIATRADYDAATRKKTSSDPLVFHHTFRNYTATRTPSAANLAGRMVSGTLQVGARAELLTERRDLPDLWLRTPTVVENMLMGTDTSGSTRAIGGIDGASPFPLVVGLAGVSQEAVEAASYLVAPGASPAHRVAHRLTMLVPHTQHRGHRIDPGAALAVPAQPSHRAIVNLYDKSVMDYQLRNSDNGEGRVVAVRPSGHPEYTLVDIQLSAPILASVGLYCSLILYDAGWVGAGGRIVGVGDPTTPDADLYDRPPGFDWL